MKKVLLTILPYWSPIIPPVGIAVLKSFLQPRGYKIRAVDIVAKRESLEFYYSYFDILKKYIPEEKRGNLYNVGHDLLQHHMMAHLNYKNQNRYIQLVHLLVKTHYNVKVEKDGILELNRAIDDFYKNLRGYFLYLLEHEKPDVVGITVYKTTLPASLFVLKLVKETFPHIRTVIGGGIFADSHAVGSPNFETLLDVTGDYVDKVFIGPGELLFLKFLQGQLPESQRVYTLEDLKGRQLEFNEVAIPDFSDFNTYKYNYMAAAASVGCMYRCTFCNEAKFWGKFKKKDPGQAVTEMMALYKKYNRQLFFMTDSLLNPVVTNLAEKMLDKRAPLYYDAFFRIDKAAADIQTTMLWRRGGLYRVRLGIESGSQRMLDKMGKGITVDQIKAALTSLAFAGIKTTTYWIIGHPGETEADFQKTLDLIEELKDFIWQAECNPFRYFFNNQNNSDQWAKYRIPLFPEETKNLLLFQEWALNLEPSREVTIDRINRFVRHCKKLGIPNPYSSLESCQADDRWKALHKNAAPSLLDFVGEKSFVDEIKNFRPQSFAVTTRKDASEFNF